MRNEMVLINFCQPQGCSVGGDDQTSLGNVIIIFLRKAISMHGLKRLFCMENIMTKVNI